MQQDRWIRKHALSVTITVLLTGALTILVAPAQDFLKSIPGRIAEFFSLLGEPVSISRWSYWLLIATFGCLVLGVVLAFVSYVIARSKQKAKPDYYDYTEDRFFG